MAFLRMPRGKDEPKALGELGAKPFRGGEENRAKDAKDAKVRGMKDKGTGQLFFHAEARRREEED